MPVIPHGTNRLKNAGGAIPARYRAQSLSRFSIQQVIHHRHHIQGKCGGGENAEDEAPGEAGEDGIERDDERAEQRGGGGEKDGAEPGGAGLDEGVDQPFALSPQSLDEVDENDGIAHHDTGQGNHADHGGGGEQNRIVKTRYGLGEQQIEQREAGHDADHGQRNGHHDDERHA